MHFQDPSRSDGQKKSTEPFGSPPPKFPYHFKPPRHSSRLGVRRKIFLGYILAIGIAIAGNLISNTIQHRPEKGTLATFQKADQQIRTAIGNSSPQPAFDSAFPESDIPF